ncbi:ribonuclease H-like YkuK family protein [Patescibacteria group bacterium]|nr:ribonuclease H-like YkuK family protein [Patescibacteria group bacterium]
MSEFPNGENSFYSNTYGSLVLEEVVLKIRSFLEEDPSSGYSLVIGTDSHERFFLNKKKSIYLVTAVVVHRKGYGGQYFWKAKRIFNIATLRDKIYAETATSLEFAQIFMPAFRKILNGNTPKYNLEIHIDVGEHGETREMLKEVVGMVTGNGFTAKTKPEAYGASYVADKHT